MKILITGGTVFVSRFAAEYFAKKHEVSVLNRNTRPQVPGVALIEADRHDLGDCLKGRHFDAVLDITAYNADDVNNLLNALDSFDQYLLISSSAVYPETLPQPFSEEQPCGSNRIWGPYGAGKIAAEQALLSRVPHAYVLRPPYLYGPMQNVYREPFVFDCAQQELPFFLPGDGSMPLQFFHVQDLCRFMEILLDKRPEDPIYNVGNPQTISIREWVEACYAAAGKVPAFREVSSAHSQRDYFPFYDYAYQLDVSRQQKLMPEVRPLAQGLAESLEWYREHPGNCRKKPLLDYIRTHLL